MYISDEILADFAVTSLVIGNGDLNSLFIRLCNNSTTFVLGCVYRHPSLHISDDRKLFEYIGDITRRYDKVYIFGLVD